MTFFWHTIWTYIPRMKGIEVEKASFLCRRIGRNTVEGWKTRLEEYILIEAMMNVDAIEEVSLTYACHDAS